MKLKVNPLAKLLERAEFYTNNTYMARTQDVAHDRKRRLAEQAVAGQISPEFEVAAELEGMSPAGLAAVILAKPDALMERENARRAVIVRLRAAKSEAELNQIMNEAQVILPPPGTF